MAAARRPKRKTRFPKKKKQTRSRKKKYRKLLPKRGRKQCRKQGKRGKIVVRKLSGSQKPGMRRPYDEFISKVLRRLHRDKIPISNKAKGKMISFIRKFYNTLSDKARCNKRVKQSCSISSKEMQNALKKVMSKKHASDLVQTIRKEPRRY